MAADLHPRHVVVAAHNLIAHTADFVGNAVIALAHEPFDGGHGVFRVGHRLTLCRITNFAFTLTVIKKSDYGGGRAVTLAVGDDNRLVAFHHCHT